MSQLMEGFRHRYPPSELARLEECLRINFGGAPLPELPTYQRPNLFFFPGLTRTPYVDPLEHVTLREAVEKLERAAPRLREEYLKVVTPEDLRPYLDEHPDRFAHLRAQDWGTFYLQAKGGERIAESCVRSPQSAALLDELEPYMSPGGAFLFSVIAPGVSVPPHHDSANFKLTCHLGLIIPPDCAIRVGGETRVWEEGHCVVFDDTFQHEVWNRSDQPRVCLIVDLWHPLLTAVEREVIATLAPIVGEHVMQGFLPTWAVDSIGSSSSAAGGGA
ncbi:aspartyl/asparaginyl beta-hydroxylase domain-containing protein [Polyangium fumosum]|uniref:aspartyl/asparaginyl beta-hydroxylase domain-containing protein n=1 Tax=Polyangium fumosum TaxID=889272 RepID=UPI001E5DA1A4|nr:aspartyl/asparaginyl beta-hydroxylase domain-containing protein [Polyangium fumosum]